jgi:hypothetical protein
MWYTKKITRTRIKNLYNNLIAVANHGHSTSLDINLDPAGVHTSCR